MAARSRKIIKPKANPLYRAAEYLLLLVGFACLAVFGYVWLESHLFQSYEDYELESSLKGRPPSWLGYARSVLHLDDESGKSSEDSQQAYQDLQKKTLEAPDSAPPMQVPANGLIGRIEIPRLNVSAIIREGVDDTTLRRAAGHVPGTAMPGQDGNFAVAAHRDTFFRGLRDVQENDQIRIVTTKGTFEYVVRNTTIVTPQDVEILDPQRKREMTLITCYPFNFIGHAPKRFIVRAEQMDNTGIKTINPVTEDELESKGSYVPPKSVKPASAGAVKPRKGKTRASLRSSHRANVAYVSRNSPGR